MGLHQLADTTAEEIVSMLGQDDSKVADVAAVIESALKKAILDTKKSCEEAVNICCTPEQDLAHKIKEQMNQAEKLLISNLSSLR